METRIETRMETNKQNMKQDSATIVPVETSPETSLLLSIQQELKTQLMEKALELIDKSENISISSNTFMNLVRYGMELMELTKVKGVEQRDMLIMILLDILDDLETVPEEKKDIFRSFIKSDTLKEMIDMIVLATKGELRINKIPEILSSSEVVEEVATNCCLAFLSSFRKTK